RTPGRRRAEPSARAGLIAEVVELQRAVELAALEQRDRRLQVVALLAVDAQLVAVDLAVDLELGFLQRGLELLCQLAFDALLDADLLARAGQVGLDVPELQAAGVYAARDQPGPQDVGHLLELELARRGLGDDLVVQFEAGVHALEVEAVAQLAVGLVHGIGQFVAVDFGDNVKGRHGDAQGGWRDSVASARRPRSGRCLAGAAEGDDRLSPDGRARIPRPGWPGRCPTDPLLRTRSLQ